MDFKKSRFWVVLALLILTALAVVPATAQDELDGSGWCSGVKIRFFAG